MRMMKITHCAAVVAFLLEIFTFASGFNVTFDPPTVEKLFVDDAVNVTVSLRSEVKFETSDDFISLGSEPESVVVASFATNSWECETIVCNRTIQVSGRFLGFGKVFLLQKDLTLGSGSQNISKVVKLTPSLNVTVLRQDTILNKLFTIFVASVVTINYINFGCALELNVVKEVLKRPVAPALGFVCQFIIMPLVSYGVGYLLFSDPVLRLGLFTFGCSPGGGASNMWTVLLGGNLNLSITMTVISTVAAFGTIPLWLFSLGQTIIKDANIDVPYMKITISLVSLVIPIAIGLLIQKYLPKVAAKSKRLLAPICIILLIGIIVLASVANTYIFFMLSWEMVIATSLNVWTGFLAGVLVSTAFRFGYKDVVAVSVETGIQNTGIAFFLLSYSLPHPISDMAAVVPVAASIITPIPLFAVFCFRKIRNCCFRTDAIELQTLKDKKDEYQSTKSVMGCDTEEGSEMNGVSNFR